jgi:hypothetical protein
MFWRTALTRSTKDMEMRQQLDQKDQKVLATGVAAKRPRKPRTSEVSPDARTDATKDTALMTGHARGAKKESALLVAK